MREEGYIPRTVNEHLQVSLRTGACHLLACASFVGMDDIATKDSFDWVSTMPKIVKDLCIILRLLDDLQSYEVMLISWVYALLAGAYEILKQYGYINALRFHVCVCVYYNHSSLILLKLYKVFYDYITNSNLCMQQEQLTPHVASTIKSYMKEHNVSIQIARKKIEELKEDTWKDFNHEWLNPDNGVPRQLLESIFNMTRTMEFMYNQDDNFTNCRNLKDTIHLLFVEPFAISF